MGNLVRSFGWVKANSSSTQKATALLSDGVTRVAMVMDANQTGVTGDGGDNTGVPKAYVYTSSNGSTWTLRATITISVLASLSTRPSGSFSVGANNNIHFVYRASDGTVKYHLITFGAGPTYTPGAAETALPAAAANEFYVRIDVDALGTGNNAIVAAGFSRTVATKSYVLRSAVRTNTPAWVSLANQTLVSNDQHMAYTDEITVAADQTAIGGDFLTTAAIWVGRKTAGGIDTGDPLYVLKINVSTGVAATFTRQFNNLFSGVGGGFRKLKLFNTATDTYVLAGSLGADPYRMVVGKFSLTRSTMAYTQILPWTTRDQGRADRTLENFHWADVAYCPGDRLVFTRRSLSSTVSYRVVTVATINSDGSVTWSDANKIEANYLANSSVNASQMWMGTPRNYSATILPYMSAFTSNGSVNSYRLEWFEKGNPSAGTVTSPGAGSSIISDLPVLKGTHKLPTDTPPFRTKLEFSLATDSGFTTNLRTVTEPNTDFKLASGTSSATLVTSEEALPAVSELFQGTWFIRQRAMDETGAFGSYSPTVSFTVAHAPVGANLYPTAGKIFIYGTGVITFSWDFTDPSPSDIQTAYQVIIRNLETNAIVVDTGKVVSANKSASPTIPVGSKDTDLIWTLTLWDSDDVAGPLSTPQLFSITDAPLPTVVSPTPSQVLTAANPTITWTSGVSGAKTQVEYRVVISKSGSVIYDTNWVVSASLSHNVPTGYLTNGSSYSVTVYVKDNYNLTAQVTQLFSTSWTLPATRTLQSIYLSEYAKDGYVHVTIDPTGFDADFLAWCIYRREYGTTDWNLLTRITKTSDIVTYRDYTAGAGVLYQYAVTQLVDRFGDYVESAISNSTVLSVRPQADAYWLLNELVPSLSLPLYNVVSDDFEDEYEEATYNVIGRGRHVDYGDRLGYTGTLKCQLRTRTIGGVERTNWIINPSLSYADPGPTPNSWTLSSTGTVGTLTEDFIQTQDPSPSDVDSTYRVNASGLGTAVTDTVLVSQVLLLDPSIIVGDVCTFSIWVNDVQGVLTGKRLEIGMRWETAGSVLVRDDLTQSPTAIETYTSSAAGSPDFGSTAFPVTGQWKRFSISGAMPATAAQIRVRIQMEGTGSGTVGSRDLVITGAQFEKGSAASSYIDGRTRGGDWLGADDLSASYHSGFYSARAQRLAIEAVKANKTSGFLRTPFGDIKRVATGNLGVTRIAGTGPTEYTDVTIPYQEVAF